MNTVRADSNGRKYSQWTHETRSSFHAMTGYCAKPFNQGLPFTALSFFSFVTIKRTRLES